MDQLRSSGSTRTHVLFNEETVTIFTRTYSPEEDAAPWPETQWSDWPQSCRSLSWRSLDRGRWGCWGSWLCSGWAARTVALQKEGWGWWCLHQWWDVSSQPHSPAKGSCSPLMSIDWGMLPTSMQDTCLGVFLKRSLGGASISWDRKNFSGCVMGGRKPRPNRTDTERFWFCTAGCKRETNCSYRTGLSPAPPRKVLGSAGARTRRRTGSRPAARFGTSPRAGRERWAAAGSWAAGPAAVAAWPEPNPPWSGPPSQSNDGSAWRGSRRCCCRPHPRWCSAGWTVPSGPESSFPATVRSQAENVRVPDSKVFLYNYSDALTPR